MHHEAIARRMPRPQREMLVEHVHGPVSIVRKGGACFTQMRLIDVGLLYRSMADGANTSTIRPTHTAMTENGREVVCWILAEYADALVRAGCFDPAVQLNATLVPAINEALTKLGYGRGYGQDHRVQ